jgi:hypothetical protein
VPDLSDHLSFLFRFPVPFRYRGACSLDPMYGPAGLDAIIGRAIESVPADRLTLTLEVHQAEGRLPLAAGARPLFRQWADPTNAERFNYWLSVVADNYLLATTAVAAATTGPAAGPGPAREPAGLPIIDPATTVSR